MTQTLQMTTLTSRLLHCDNITAQTLQNKQDQVCLRTSLDIFLWRWFLVTRGPVQCKTGTLGYYWTNLFYREHTGPVHTHRPQRWGLVWGPGLHSAMGTGGRLNKKKLKPDKFFMASHLRTTGHHQIRCRTILLAAW